MTRFYDRETRTEVSPARADQEFGKGYWDLTPVGGETYTVDAEYYESNVTVLDEALPVPEPEPVVVPKGNKR